MNIQFCHNRIYNPKATSAGDEINPRGGTTIALEVPHAWLLESLVIGDFFTKQVGKARCSDDDNYNKKTGRDLATSRMLATFLTVLSNSEYSGGIRIVTLTDKDGAIYTLKKNPACKTVHFISYE